MQVCGDYIVSLMKLTFCYMYFLYNHKQEAAKAFLPHNFYKVSMKEFHSIRRQLYIYHTYCSFGKNSAC